MNNQILSKKNQESQLRFVPRESNLDLGQFFYPDEKSKRFSIREFSSSFTDVRGNNITTKVLIKPDATLGTLTTFDERVMYALLELWKEQGQPYKVKFSHRELLRRLRTKIGRDTLKAVQNSIERLGGVMLRWESCFYIKSQDRHLELLTPFTIITNVKVATNKSKGIGTAVCEFSFNENFLNNLKANYCRPVRFDVILNFKTPLAQAVYTLIDRKLFGTKQYHRTTAGLLIDDLGLKVKSYQRQAIRVEKLLKIRDELKGQPLSFGEVIEVFEVDTNREGDDAVVFIQRTGESNLKSRKVAYLPSAASLEVITPVKTAQKAYSEAKKPLPISNPSKKRKACEEASVPFKEPSQLVKYFFGEFVGEDGGDDIYISTSALNKAKTIIKSHGLDGGKEFIDFAKSLADKTNYQPKSLQGILQYLPDWERFKKDQQIKNKIDRKNRKQIEKAYQEARKNNHEKKYQHQYYKYVEQRLEVISEISPGDFLAFTKGEKLQVKELEEAIASKKGQESIARLQLRVFNRQEQRVLRAVEFFQDKKHSIFSFWQWDNSINSESFS